MYIMYMLMYMYVCVYIYIYIYNACVYVCIYIYICICLNFYGYVFICLYLFHICSFMRALQFHSTFFRGRDKGHSAGSRLGIHQGSLLSETPIRLGRVYVRLLGLKWIEKNMVWPAASILPERLPHHHLILAHS